MTPTAAGHKQVAEALTYVQRWIEFASDILNHSWNRDEYVFPSLTRVIRASVKRSRPTATASHNVESFKRVGVRWGAALTENNFVQILNIVAGKKSTKVYWTMTFGSRHTASDAGELSIASYLIL
ncbi:LOW QUALITY PROTEIN: hypothetical protein PHMEG_00023854 [Phytophthora megakarya]|uniref:Uncharacterized protein n=1 Tax=Phytophthora megakarya TaxID=4795 RepID=A0A225VF34_9STRA|nr:LOW QUALITY PROTEIN: hypothetical protein PHMEG_00023854 [Phytophthora megakarya]